MDIIRLGQNREEIRKEILISLQNLENEGWKIFGFSHMNMDKRRWLKEPQNLTGHGYYKTIKSWLLGNAVSPHKSTPDGLKLESICFNLWLLKGDEVCIVSYGEHKFDNEAEAPEGRTAYSIKIVKWYDIIPPVLAILAVREAADNQ